MSLFYSIFLLLVISIIPGNTSQCMLGDDKPTCDSWYVLSTFVFKTNDSFLTEKATQFLQNITSNCKSPSSLRLFLPGWDNSTNWNSGGTEMGTASMAFLESINATMTFTSATNPMDTVDNMMNDMVIFGVKQYTDPFFGKVAFIFTNADCNNMTLEDRQSIDANIQQLRNLSYIIRFVFFDSTNSTSCNFTSCPLGFKSYPPCGISYDLPNYEDSTTCPAYIVPTNPSGSTQSRINATQKTTTTQTTTIQSTTTMNPGWQLTPLELGLVIGIPCATFVICCGICACCCCKCLEIRKIGMLFAKTSEHNPDHANKYRDFFKEMRKWKKGKYEPSAPPMDPCAGEQVVPNFAVSNHYMDIEQLAARNKKDDWEFQEKNLLIHDNEVLGAGAFASVYRCTIIGKIPLLKAVNGAAASLENADGRTEGAVKRLPAHADDQNKKDFFHEMEFMKRLGYHIHIIAMLGCVSDQWDPLIVVEYCHHGDLLRLVRAHRTDFFGNGSSSASEKSVTLNVKQLVSFAWQVSDGMTYLASKNFVHRDLAARNILVTKSMVVKVSDFGLCRYTDEALYTAKGGKLPIKWMSPEALKFGEFSVKSDVWSFGVFLWEIFSLGETPYNAIQPTDMLIHLEDGNRLPRPQFCPFEIYRIALDCWQESAEKRPTFDEIRSKLTLMLNLNDESYGYLTVIRKEHANETETCPVDGFFTEKL